jgi:hypothetical protein
MPCPDVYLCAKKSPSQFLHLQNENSISRIAIGISEVAFFFFLVVLGFEFRASHLLGRWSTTWAMPQPISEVIYFEGWAYTGMSHLHCYLTLCSPTSNVNSSPSLTVSLRELSNLPAQDSSFCLNGQHTIDTHSQVVNPKCKIHVKHVSSVPDRGQISFMAYSFHFLSSQVVPIKSLAWHISWK